ncbi:hypothetical protein BGW36DRAFT_285553 [Talaromyces proteolyticus]|uniref:Zn(2)-C6 fungal-type domain-containing protein n=1 Tax=Talaromyces proteolyticus TaxID=1131652 RepID=A0AAD4Q607_9EURO|nr:uncharacterized protein BGW36DRAFT_285553 [Talaromyces proteolyticus]KAH8704877.1 hypothetical protein BGW36DRAFT_285553 [Talaromyces proteolyticus]
MGSSKTPPSVGHDDYEPEVSASASSATSRPVRRRNRMITSCLECRRRKLKCDRLHPCTNCSKGKRDCLFLAPSLDSTARLKLTELKERMGTLERSLEEEVAVQATRGTPATNSEPLLGWNDLDKEESTDFKIDAQKELEPTRLAVMDAVYDDEADDVMVDLGIQLGRMRVTDRIGGYVRPRIADELSATLKWSLKAFPASDTDSDDSELSKWLELAASGAPIPFLQPGPTFIAPHSDMLLGPILHDHALLDLLPTRAAADKLLQKYWESCHPVARILHRQAFEKRYEVLWENVSQGIEPVPSIQAIVFATLFTAAVSMTASETLGIFGVDRQSLIQSFQLGTETALGKAHFLRTTKTETLQAFVMYLIPMCRDTISRAHSALVGAAIRLAECMGMHRDPSEYNYGPVETHVRRLIWYQLCFLDIRTAETQGPRVSIRREDYSTKFPLNINDADLMAGSLEDSPGWTDMTFARIRFECQEMARVVFTDRVLLEKKALSITSAIGKIETFRKAVFERWGPVVNISNPTPTQRAASVTMSFLLNRLPISLLHRWYNSYQKMPDRLTQIIVTTGAQQLEDAVTLETSPELKPWVWYSRAYHNFHTAFLLLSDISNHPLRREADRIWRCLEYVYELDQSTLSQTPTRQEIIEDRRRKTNGILRQFRDRMHVYQTMRRLKHSADLDEVEISGFVSEPRSKSPKPASKSDEPQFSMGPINLIPGIHKEQVLLNRARQIPSSQYSAYGTVPTTSPIPHAHQPSPGSRNYETMPPQNRGLSAESETARINEAIVPAFMPGVPNASAGTARSGKISIGSSPNSDDLPMLDIDWVKFSLFI